VDKSVDQTAIIGYKYFRQLSPIITFSNFIPIMKFQMAINLLYHGFTFCFNY